MSDTPHLDLWRLPAYALIVVLLIAGLFPELVFYQFRDLAWVSSRTALVNSYYFITFSLAVYIFCFTLIVSVNAGMDSMEARGKALQLAVIALLAFLPIRLDHFQEYADIRKNDVRYFAYGVIGAKLLADFVLFLIFTAYYLGKGPAVFRTMPSIFPSVRVRNDVPLTPPPQ